ncbi:hypothetical protein V6N13_072132 [Hibiscus sabdariffa]|uniref:H15 domain-containing protein n=1 Tax=Hibiscus sabdariffa TaxID=183260 RepID=A0ABR2TCB0_9ROSI
MEEKHKAVLPANFRKILSLQLKNSAGRGKLIKVKASYKLSEAGTKGKATVTKGKAKPAAKPKKKSTPAKPKQPKSIKSGALRRNV